ncbi:hypothetical protein M1563_03715 [Patescibacteria group bacterium]|nr:hypothetical protein [Patescibacteria group bacterium]
MFDFAGKATDHAGPSMPVEVLGFESVPAVGADLGEEVAAVVTNHQANLLSFRDKLKVGEKQVLSVIIKADKQGSLEAIETALEQFNQEEKHLEIIHSGTGNIIESDIEMAETAKAIILGFNVEATSTAKKMAEVSHVLIRTYNVIYELIDEIKDVVEGILQPGEVEEVFGKGQIIAEFEHGKDRKIAGCKILEGQISKGPKVRVVRGEDVIGEGKIESLKRLKEEVPKVEQGQECGILFATPIDFQVGDIVESYRLL